MNLSQLKKNAGFRVQLEPPAIHLDVRGRELPGKNEDWIIGAVSDTEIHLNEAIPLGLTTKIGKDAVHHFTTNPSRSTVGGLQYGFLMLTVQMYIHENVRITYRPCRPGERVDPSPTPIAQKWVDLQYPHASGIQEKLERAGYHLGWCPDSRLAQLELQGWDVVVENDRHGMPTTFHVRTHPENQVLVKTLRP